MKPVKWNGNIITQPGIYEDIPIEEYHNNTKLLDSMSTSSSSLKVFAERPSLYWAYSAYNPNRFEREPKPHYTFGQAAHHLILGEENFNKYFAIRPQRYDEYEVVEDLKDTKTGKVWSGNSKVCKAWIEKITNEGKQILKLEELEAIYHIADRLEKTEEVKQGIISGGIETSMFYKFGKIWLRSRPDVVPVHSGDYADTKFVADIDYNNIEKNIYRFGYNVQAAICRMVSRELFGSEYPFNYFLIFIEKTPPYDVYSHELNDVALDKGEELVRASLKYMEQCVARNEWPGRDGFNPIITKIGIPPWAVTQTDIQIQHIKSQLSD